MGSVISAHEARIAGEIHATEATNIEHSQLVLGYRHEPAVPRDWMWFTETRIVSSARGLVTAIQKWIDTERPDVLHLHLLWAGLAGGVAARLSRGRPLLVYEIHGAIAFEAFARHRGIAGWLRFLLLYVLESLAILLSDRLVLVSDAIRNYYPLARLRPSVTIRRVVEESTLAPAFEHVSDELRALRVFAAEQRHDGRKILVYSGGLAEWQMFEETVATMATAVDAGLAAAVVLTKSTESARRVVARYLADTSRIHVASLDQREVVAGLHECDAGFLLRADTVVNRVASPTKFFEYLSAGLHVVTTRGAATIAPLVEAHRVGLVVKIAEATDHVIPWLNSKSFSAWEKSRIRSLARSEYTWSAGAESLRSIYAPDSQGDGVR